MPPRRRSPRRNRESRSQSPEGSGTPHTVTTDRRYHNHRVKWFQKLEGIHDYLLWAFKAKAALKQTQCWSAIVGDEPVDQYTEDMAHSHLILWLSDGVLTQVKNIELAKPLWDKLRAFYEPSGFSTDFLYLKEFFDTKLEAYDSMEDYVAKLKTLTDDLRKHEFILPDKLVMAWTFFYLTE